jgi:hypothetical protein
VAICDTGAFFSDRRFSEFAGNRLHRFGTPLALGPRRHGTTLPQGEVPMRKKLGMALALVLVMSLPAAAEMAKGKVKEVDKGKQIFMLEDGTRIWVTAGYVNELMPGDDVVVMYETKGDAKVATELDRRVKTLDGTMSSNFGSRSN